MAYASDADEIGYGGAAGGGKTDFILGLAITKHRKSLILRREFTQLKGIIARSEDIIGDKGRLNRNSGTWQLPNGRIIDLGGCVRETDKRKYQGQPHDLIAFDEATEFLKSQRDFITGWARAVDANQKVQVIYTFNPPTTPEGLWIVELFGPWLKEDHPNPAMPGELRWYVRHGDVEEEVENGDPVVIDGETLYPKSRTFIPAKVDDNVFLRDTNYKATLQALPEPLRSQMLDGDFNALGDDDPWQVIPTAWVKAAQKRWQENRNPDLEVMSSLGVDIARGGKDQTVLAPRYGHRFEALSKHPGHITTDGGIVSALVTQMAQPGKTAIALDILNCGASVFDTLKGNEVQGVTGVNFAERSELKDKSGKLGFANLRAEHYWLFREALDPASGMDIELPPDNELLGDLCAPKWKLTVRGIQIEEKEEIRKRIQRSTDCGDAVVLAFRAHFVTNEVLVAGKREAFGYGIDSNNKKQVW